MNKHADPTEIAKKNALVIFDQYKDLQVTDDATYQNAGQVLVKVKTVRKQVKSVFQPIIDRMNANLKATRIEFKKYDDPLFNLEVLLKRQVVNYTAEQERKKLQLEAELQAKARKEAEDRQVAEAKKLEDMGEPDAADEVLNEELEVAPVTVDNKPRAEGVSTSKRWHAEVFDKLALIKSVAEGKQPMVLLEASMKVLNKQAVSLMEEMNIPGVKAVSTVSVAVRSE